VVGEWNSAWTTTVESGPPTSVTFSGSPNRFPSSAPNPYLNISDFDYPAAFTVGMLARNTFESPGMVWMRFSLFKSFTIAERFEFALRADGNNFPYVHWQLTAPTRSTTPAAP